MSVPSYFGSIAGGLIVILVAATDFPSQPQMVYAAVALFLIVRGLDDFVYMPMTIGKSLHMHPAITVMMLFIGGAIAGVSGLMLVLPLLGVVMVIGGTGRTGRNAVRDVRIRRCPTTRCTHPGY